MSQRVRLAALTAALIVAGNLLLHAVGYIGAVEATIATAVFLVVYTVGVVSFSF